MFFFSKFRKINFSKNIFFENFINHFDGFAESLK